MKLINWHITMVCASFLLVFTACDSGRYELNESKAKYLLLDSLVGSDTAFETAIKPYRDSLKAEMLRVIGEAKQELSGGLPESLLSNFVSDLILEECAYVNPDVKADISIINIKGLRVPINKGTVSVESIYQLMPFENEVVYLTMTSDQIKVLFNYMAQVGGDGMAGASFGIKNNQAVNIKIGGQPLEERNYIVATSDYLADGGDHFTVFLSAVYREEAGLKVRDAILQHIIRLSDDGKLINSQLDKRIYYAE